MEEKKEEVPEEIKEVVEETEPAEETQPTQDIVVWEGVKGMDLGKLNIMQEAVDEENGDWGPRDAEHVLLNLDGIHDDFHEHVKHVSDIKSRLGYVSKSTEQKLKSVEKITGGAKALERRKQLKIADYIDVLKPRETALLTFIGMAAIILGANGYPPLDLFVLATIAILLGSAGCNGLTNYLDRQVDARMKRTRKRALPSEKISPPQKILPLLIFLVGTGLVISWFLHPLCFLFGVVFVSFIFWLGDKAIYANPFFHILTGNVMLGAFFLSTDHASSPVNRWGMVVYGLGCGTMTVILRAWSTYPDGVIFACLLMSLFVPLLDKLKSKQVVQRPLEITTLNSDKGEKTIS